MPAFKVSQLMHKTYRRYIANFYRHFAGVLSAGQYDLPQYLLIIFSNIQIWFQKGWRKNVHRSKLPFSQHARKLIIGIFSYKIRRNYPQLLGINLLYYFGKQNWSLFSNVLKDVAYKINYLYLQYNYFYPLDFWTSLCLKAVEHISF